MVTKDSIWDSRSRLASGTLFERLVADEEETDLPQSVDAIDARVHSIKNHLQNLLNARKGNSASNDELGLDDFNDCTARPGDLVKHIALSIRACIDRHEPRAEIISVQHAFDPDRPLVLNFKVELSIPVANDREVVRINVLMQGGARCRVM